MYKFVLYNLQQLYFTLENSPGPKSHNTASVNYCDKTLPTPLDHNLTLTSRFPQGAK